MGVFEKLFKTKRLELLDALREAAKSQPNIQALYFCQIVFADGVPHIAMDVLPATPQSQTANLIGALDSAIQSMLSESELFDFFPSNATNLVDAIKKARKAISIA